MTTRPEPPTTRTQTASQAHEDAAPTSVAEQALSRHAKVYRLGEWAAFAWRWVVSHDGRVTVLGVERTWQAAMDRTWEAIERGDES